jgi:autotransporter-associated beta strand protein
MCCYHVSKPSWALAIFFAWAVLVAPALAIDSSWNADAAGNWSDVTKWTASIPNAAGAIARLTYDITAPRTVTIDGSARTVGSLYLSDDNCGYTLGGVGLNMNASSGSALIQSSGTGTTQTISAPVALYDPVTVAVNNAELLLSGALSSAASSTNLTKTGPGMLRLAAKNYSYTGTLAVSQGTLRIEDGEALGEGSSVTVAAGAVLDICSTEHMDVMSPAVLYLEGSSTLRNSKDYANLQVGANLLGDATIDVVSQGLSCVGWISGPGGLTKTGVGLLGLSKSGYSGATKVNAGILALWSSTSLGSSPSVTVMSGACLELSNGINISGKVLTLNGMGPTGYAALYNSYDDNTWAGPVTLAANADIGGEVRTVTVSDVISGPGSLTKSGRGRLLLTGANAYAGATIIKGGSLEARDGVSLPATTNLQLAGGVLQVAGPATFTRGLGAGNGQVRWTSSGGFSARGGKVVVNLGGNPTPTALKWGSTPYFTSATLLFGTKDDDGEATADSEIEFVNPIDLDGFWALTRTINVIDNRNTGNDFATLSGVISNGGILKRGEGTLALTGLNAYTRVTEVDAGALRAADGIGLPAASTLYLDGGVWECDGPTTFTRSLGTGSGQVQWDSGGFSAHGGKLTVNLGGAAVPLVLGDGGFPASVTFGSPTADSETEFVHSIDLNGTTASISVQHNPSTAGDFATLSGVISNGAISKQGVGTLALTGHNTYTGITRISDGALRATDGTGLPAGSNLYLNGGVLESDSPAMFTRSLGTGSGQVQWSSGGFSAHGGRMTVAVGGTASPTALTWGVGFFQAGGLLFFGSWTADNETVFTNSLNLNGAERTIKVRDNPAAGGDFATMSGVISNGSLMKTGTGTLALTATNTYTGSTTIQDGALYAIDGVGLPTASRLVIGIPNSTGSPVFESNGLFTRSMGYESGQVTLLSYSSGFAARGGKLTVAMGGLASPTLLNFSSGPPSRPYIVLLLSSCTADSEVELVNSIRISCTAAPIFVNDNPFSGSDFATISGVVSSDYAGPMKDGPGTLCLSGANTYTAATTVVGGALRATDGVGLPTASNLVLSGGVFEGKGTATFVRSLGATGANTVQWTGSGGVSAFGGKMIVAIGGIASPTALIWGSGSFVPSGSALLFGSATASKETELKNNINLAGAVRTVTVNDNPFSAGDFATLSGALSNGGLVKDGPGTLVLSGTNNLTAGATVSAGTLRLAAGTALASGNAVTVQGGSTLDIGVYSVPAGVVTLIDGTITGTTGVIVGSSYDVRKGTVSARLGGTGGLAKTTSDSVTLAGANSYTGATTVSGGILRATSGVGLPTASNLVLAGGVLEGIGGVTFTRSLGASGSDTVQWSGSGGFTASGGKMTVAIGGTASPTALTWASGNFVPSGSALMFGSTTADNATEFRNNINLGGAAQTVTVNDNPATAADFATLSGVLSNGGLLKDGIGMLVVAGANTYTGATTVKAGVLRATSGTGLPTASNLVLNGGVLEGPGATMLTRSLGTSGTNTVQWTGSGGFSASGGKMTVAIGGTASPTALTWGTGSFVPSGSALVLGSPTADSETEFVNSINLAGGTRTVTVNDNPASGTDIATLSGVLSNGGLTKGGMGLLVLKGSHTYTGATTVLAGAIELAADATLASTTFDVRAGATLDLRDLVGGLTLGAGKSLKGGGTVLGDLVVGGTVSPGESPGILSVEDVTFAAGSILNMELGGTVRGGGYDALVSSGGVVLQNGSTLSVSLISNFVPEMGDEFDILDFSSLSGRFTTINLPALAGGLSWSTDDLYLDGRIGVTPEPATLALLGLGIVGVLCRRRVRCKGVVVCGSWVGARHAVPLQDCQP